MTDYQDCPACVQIGLVIEHFADRVKISEIYSVADHGVVCPNLSLRNGSTFQLAIYLSALVDNQERLSNDLGGYLISVQIGQDFYHTFEAIQSALATAHRRVQNHLL